MIFSYVRFVPRRAVLCVSELSSNNLLTRRLSSLALRSGDGITTQQVVSGWDGLFLNERQPGTNCQVFYARCDVCTSLCGMAPAALMAN